MKSVSRTLGAASFGVFACDKNLSRSQVALACQWNPRSGHRRVKSGNIDPPADLAAEARQEISSPAGLRSRAAGESRSKRREIVSGGTSPLRSLKRSTAGGRPAERNVRGFHSVADCAVQRGENCPAALAARVALLRQHRDCVSQLKKQQIEAHSPRSETESTVGE